MSEAEYKQALPRGHLLRDYRLLDVLGVGGFGVTYVAFHEGLQEKVAVKEYLPNEFAVRDGVTVQAKSDADLDSFEWGLDRFVEEARTLARFKHANVVRVRDYFRANNTAYIVMDYEEGEALDVLLDRLGSLTPGQLSSLLLPLVDGLRQVHTAGFLHRDIKPANIFVRRSDESPVLLDFGAARQSLGRKSRNVTALVSPGYSPPEQYESDGEQGAWTDIYALSAMCYRAITGRAPVDAAQRMNRLLRGDPDPLADLADGAGDGYPAALLHAVDQGLRLKPTERTQTLDAWLAQIQATDDPAPAAEQDRSERPVRRPVAKAVWIGGAATAVALLGIALWFGAQRWSGGADSPAELATDAGEPAPVTPEDGVAAPTEDPPPASAPTAMLVVETTPPGVEVLLGDALLGKTPLEISELHSGVYALTLRHPHYQTVRLNGQTLADGEVLRVEQTMVRGTGKLTVLTEPRDAWIEHEGERLAQGTPVTLEDLPAGTVTLRIGANGYRAEELQAEVTNDHIGRLERTLERIPTGTMTIEMVPPDATVTLPDIAPRYQAGMTLPEGRYRVRVTRSGYLEAVREVVVAGDTRVQIELERAAQPFTVETTPANARVRFVGRTDAYRPGMELPPGDYRVEVRAPGFEPADEIIAHGGGASRRQIVLEKLTAGMRFRDCPTCPALMVLPTEALAMGVFEVTFAEWDACAADGGCAHRPDDMGWGRGDRPVVDVSWRDVQEYLAWLSRRTGETYRLPSGAQWEVAARAGAPTAYAWGDDIGSGQANCDGCGSEWDKARTAPVGSFAPNAFGLHDMHGNVWEWTGDCWEGDCERRVLRGGSWFVGPEFLKAGEQDWSDADDREVDLGFRVARPLPPP